LKVRVKEDVVHRVHVKGRAMEAAWASAPNVPLKPGGGEKGRAPLSVSLGRREFTSRVRIDACGRGRSNGFGEVGRSRRQAGREAKVGFDDSLVG
jgi:hypothetical protein